MRLIAQFALEEQAFIFSRFLSKKQVQHQCDRVETEFEVQYNLWVYLEEDVNQTVEFYSYFLKHPEDPCFLISSLEEEKAAPSPAPFKIIRKPFFLFFPLTYFILALCVAFYVWNGKQESSLDHRQPTLFSEGIVLTPLQKTFFFDHPRSVEETSAFIQKYGYLSREEIKQEDPEVERAFAQLSEYSFWKGFFYVCLSKLQKKVQKNFPPMFEKIRQGEVWRLVTPSFMHMDFFHIFCNMAWLLLLGKQIEARLKKTRMLLLIFALAAGSNVAQYLMSGPYFIGFSGVVTGLTAFIWARQKKAPWEGYPLGRFAERFLAIFVIGVSVLSFVSFFLQAWVIPIDLGGIANTAHVTGGLLGFLLGQSPFFARRTI